MGYNSEPLTTWNNFTKVLLSWNYSLKTTSSTFHCFPLYPIKSSSLKYFIFSQCFAFCIRVLRSEPLQPIISTTFGNHLNFSYIMMWFFFFLFKTLGFPLASGLSANIYTSFKILKTPPHLSLLHYHTHCPDKKKKKVHFSLFGDLKMFIFTEATLS